ncbi:hypothetical protein OESDEN_07483 [Oesophagostomum dentatum]|uniref:7TM GPCR serpentine receptor class x (Srx) domain-containing protein n=1 Tax=Oesophagostomum dentatum TaxID=61180 RepID=A0A0B1TBD6_OESDE|nr:hypothetical protein OESDEN_07483 [Oesophagostomum dentatum]
MNGKESRVTPYLANKWIFVFADTKCGFVISTYTDNYTSTAVLIMIFLLDCTTLIKLRRTNNTLYQNLLFFYEMSNFYYVSVMFENQWAVFLTSTIPWEACHAFDGFIVVLFHFKLSFIGMNGKESRVTPLHGQLEAN